MPIPNESQLAAALAHCAAHLTASIRTVATLFNVSRSTLARRLQDGLLRAIAHTHEQLLSPKQEDLLAEWILQLEKNGHTPGPRIIRDMACFVSLKSDGSNRVGRKWVERFLKRHPELY